VTPLAEPGRGLVLGLGGGWLAHLLYDLTDAVTLGARPGFLWRMLLDLIARLYRLTETAASGIPDPRSAG